MSNSPITLDVIKTAIAGNVAAIRRVRRLHPAGGAGDKIFPPTYSDGPYAEEKRVVDGTKKDTVLLDSVQSQANRMELALLRAYRGGRVKFPIISVDFSGAADPQVSEIGELTTLETPHRIADAIIRDSEWNGVDFRKSELGIKFESASAKNATPLFELCPAALIFGMWDSTGTRGGLGTKFARALVSEISGVGTEKGVRTSSRIDPLGIESVKVFATPDGDWTTDSASAKKDPKGQPMKYKREGKPSELNHGNVTPTINDDKGPRHGGVTLEYALQTTVLSLPALRRLQFPVARSLDSRRDLAAQTTLASLALAAIVSMDRDGYDLRSRCLLDGAEAPFELVEAGVATPFSLTADGAYELVRAAAAEAVAFGLPWPTEAFVLKPKLKLQDLISKSRQAKATTTEEE